MNFFSDNNLENSTIFPPPCRSIISRRESSILMRKENGSLSTLSINYRNETLHFDLFLISSSPFFFLQKIERVHAKAERIGDHWSRRIFGESNEIDDIVYSTIRVGFFIGFFF